MSSLVSQRALGDYSLCLRSRISTRKLSVTHAGHHTKPSPHPLSVTLTQEFGKKKLCERDGNITVTNLDSSSSASQPSPCVLSLLPPWFSLSTNPTPPLASSGRWRTQSPRVPGLPEAGRQRL